MTNSMAPVLFSEEQKELKMADSRKTAGRRTKRSGPERDENKKMKKKKRIALSARQVFK